MRERKHREIRAFACHRTAQQCRARMEPRRSSPTVHALSTASLMSTQQGRAPTYPEHKQGLAGARSSQMDGNYWLFVLHVVPQLQVHYQFLAASHTVDSHELTVNESLKSLSHAWMLSHSNLILFSDSWFNGLCAWPGPIIIPMPYFWWPIKLSCGPSSLCPCPWRN